MFLKKNLTALVKVKITRTALDSIVNFILTIVLKNSVGDSVFGMCQVARLVTTVTNGRTTKASGFCVPFGLLCVDPQDTSTSFRLVLNLAPGTYHGVYAERA